MVDAPQNSMYALAGVDAAAKSEGMARLLGWVSKTLAIRDGVGSAKLPIGFYASVLDLGGGQGIAISTDSVGTKVLVAQMLGKYDTIGIDCVAINVNDVLCVGARPIALVDCLSVQKIDPDVLEEIGRGLYEGAKMAEVSIPGGELAQVRELIQGIKEGSGLDLVGTCVGTVPMDRIIVGQDIREGDVVVGLASSGVHCNGLTLARDVLFRRGGLTADSYVEELSATVGEELLKPTRIYVPEIMEMLDSGLAIKALAHISGDGLLNLLRVASDIGYVIDNLLEPPPLFHLIQRVGGVPDQEMHMVFNMGVGFCVVVAQSDAEGVISIAKKHGVEAQRIGYATESHRGRVVLPAQSLIGDRHSFSKL